MDILFVLSSFINDERTLTLAAFIFADVVLGIAAALRMRVFRWRELSCFYSTNVVPYLLGYLLIYTLSAAGVSALLGSVFGEIVATIGVGPAILTLTASIARNLQYFHNPELGKAVNFSRPELED